MTASDLGPQPIPEPEKPDGNPGGADALDDTGSLPLPHDLPPEANPALEEVDVPEGVTEDDDEKTQEPDDGKVSGEDDTPEEPSA